MSSISAYLVLAAMIATPPAQPAAKAPKAPAKASQPAAKATPAAKQKAVVSAQPGKKVPAKAPRKAKVAKRPGQAFNLDVFYCAGDPLEAQRMADGKAFSEAVSQWPKETLVEGYYLDRVRLRAISPWQNLQFGYRRTGASIWVDRWSTAEHLWASKMVPLAGDGAVIGETTVDSAHYVSAFFCDRFDLGRSAARMQVWRAEDKAEGARVLGELSTALPAIVFAAEVAEAATAPDGAPEVPHEAQVRFVMEGQRKDAGLIADQLTQVLKRPAQAVKIPAVEQPANPYPSIEIWFGPE